MFLRSKCSTNSGRHRGHYCFMQSSWAMAVCCFTFVRSDCAAFANRCCLFGSCQSCIHMASPGCTRVCLVHVRVLFASFAAWWDIDTIPENHKNNKQKQTVAEIITEIHQFQICYTICRGFLSKKNFQNLHLGPLSKVIMEGLVLLACEHEHLLARHVLGLVESTAMKCQEVTWKEPQRNQCGQTLHDVIQWGSEFAKMTMLKMARTPRIEATVPRLLCRLLTCFCWKEKVSESCDSRFQL